MNSVKPHWSEFGNPDAPPIVFAHGLGLDETIWQPAIEALESKKNFRIVTYDLRGHGRSSPVHGRGAMGAFVRDVETLMDDLNTRDAVVIGHGFGGMVAQGLAIKRLDLVRGLVLVNTSAKLGTKEHWATQIKAVSSGSALRFTSDLWDKWFKRSERNEPYYAPWKAMLDNTDPRALIAVMEAISGTDLYTPISGLRLPTLGLSAYNDQMFPPDLMHETLDVIQGAEFEIMARVGHLSMLESPSDFAKRIDTFLHQIGHQKMPYV